jgi:hypothetical protein
MLRLLEFDNRNRGKMLTVTSVLLLAFAVAAPVLRAQDWDQINGRDKANDPTGAWLIRNSEGQFILTTFHKGGTLTGDVQGESAFILGSPPPLDIIVTPESGVWQKTGARTFAATFLTIEYQGNPQLSPTVSIFQFDKVHSELQRARRTLTSESVV